MVIVPFLSGLAVVLAVLCGLLGAIGAAPSPGFASGRVHALAARVPWRSVFLAVLAGLAVGWLTGWPVAAIAAVTAVLAVPRVLRQRDNRADIQRLEALATWTRRIVDVLGSGAGGMESAITASVRTAPEPLATAVRALADRTQAQGLETALRAFADDLQDPAADEIVMAMILRSRAGGRGLLDVLADHATTLTAAVAARREIDAERDKPRATIRALLWISAVVIGGVLAFGGSYLSPLSTFSGQLVLAVACTVSATGIWWMNALCRPLHHNRLLSRTSPPGSRRSRPAETVGATGGA